MVKKDLSKFKVSPWVEQSAERSNFGNPL